MKNQWQLDPIYFAPQRKLGGGWLCFKDSPSPPPAPDYVGAANATSQGSIQAMLANNLIARPSVSSPLGSQTWKQTGTSVVPAVGNSPKFSIPTYAQTITLSPEQQRLYDQQGRLSIGVGNVAEGQLGRVAAAGAQPFDMSKVSPDPVASDLSGANRMTKSIMDRNRPIMDRTRSMSDTQLANQGIMRGSEAYKNAQDDLARQENDFALGAIKAGSDEQSRLFGLGSQDRQQDIQEQAFLRSLPLSEFNALRTGAMPQMPQFQPTNYTGGAQGPNMMGATAAQSQYDQGLYNSQVANSNSQMSGLVGIAGAAASAY